MGLDYRTVWQGIRTPELVKGNLYQQVGTMLKIQGNVMPTDIPAPVCPGSSLELPPPVTLTFPTILRVPSGRDSKEAQRSGLEQVSGCGERGCQGRNRPAAQTEHGSFGL